MMTSIRILFAGNFHWNAGSSHMIAAYAKAAASVPCEIAVSGQLARLDAQVPRHLPLVDDVNWATHLVFVFEGRQFLSDTQIDLCQQVPRHRRLIIDPDAHWGPSMTVGLDDSHSNYTAASWHNLYAQLSDVILQPRTAPALPPGAEYFPYFGMPEIHRRATNAPEPSKLPYELQYIGSNWWRWQTLSDVVRAAAATDPRIERIRVCGRWWDGETCPGHEQATIAEPNWLSDHGVEVAASVPFGHVVSEMASSAINPILVRPVLAQKRLLTPRMFETLASGSLPALTEDLAYLAPVYGDGAEHFYLGAEPSETLARMLRDHVAYRQRLADIQTRAYAAFNYERVLADLVKFLQ